MAEKNPLVDSTVCLILHFRRPGIKRKLDHSQFSAQDAEKDLVGAQKKIVDSPEYGQVVAFETSIKGFVRSKSLPSRLYRDSTYLIPLKSAKAVDAYLTQARKDWQDRVDEFISVYPARFKATAKRLGKIASEADRMTTAELKASFAFDHEYVTLSTPSTLKQISADLYEREQEALEKRLSAAHDDIVVAFRGKFQLLVEAMYEMLTGKTKDGKTQKFFGTKVERLQKFIEAFSTEQNVCGDDKLQKLMTTAGKLLAGVDPKELRDDDKWKESMAGSFEKVMKELGTLTKVRGKRQIDVDDAA